MSTAPVFSASEQNKRLIVRWFEEVWNQGRREAIHELMDPSCVLYDGPITIKGPVEFDGLYDTLRASFSNFQITPDVVVAEGDLVCLRWTCTCRHTATDKLATVTGISVVRIRDGRFVEGWQNWDASPIAALAPEALGLKSL